MRSAPLIVFLATVLLTNGCVVSQSKKFGVRPAPVQIQACQEKPSVAVAVRFDSDESLLGTGLQQSRLMDAMTIVSSEAARCFQSIEVESYSVGNSSAALRVDLRMQIHNNLTKEFTVGFVAGFSFFLIPTWCTFPYTMTYRISDRSGEELMTAQLEDSLVFFQHLIVLPASFTVVGAEERFFMNFARTIFSDTDWDALARAARERQEKREK